MEKEGVRVFMMAQCRRGRAAWRRYVVLLACLAKECLDPMDAANVMNT